MRMTRETNQAKNMASMNTLYNPPTWVFLTTLLPPSSSSLSSSPYNPISKPHLEQHILICEQPFFKRDDDKLGAFELGAEELMDMREI